MRTKPKDVRYCGVNKRTIQFADPVFKDRRLALFVRFVKERYRIHMRKDVLGREKPWTKDPILQKYRFTNVRREHDKETKWLIEHITSNSELTYEDKLLNCVLFRLFNKHETAELIGVPIRFSDNWDPEDYRSVFEEALEDDPERVFFTGAFSTGGLKAKLIAYSPNRSEDNMNMRVLWFIRHIMNEDICSKIDSCKSQDKVVGYLSRFSGIGRFLSYQIFVDFTYIEDFPFSENEFTVAGPGCVRGLKELFEDCDNMTPEECIFWIRDNWLYINRDLPHKLNPDIVFSDLDPKDRYMNVMSLENCFCEFSKYVKARSNKGVPKQRYKGV